MYGVPAWAARPAEGCEQPGTLPRSRPLTVAGLDSYRALVAALIELARREGADVAYWSPWNEPNHPYFISPQRERCDPAAPSLAPARYAALAEVMAHELRSAAPGSTLVLGELAAFARPAARATGIGEFVSALPAALVCSSPLWSVHAYVSPGGCARAARRRGERARARSTRVAALGARRSGSARRESARRIRAGPAHPVARPSARAAGRSPMRWRPGAATRACAPPSSTRSGTIPAFPSASPT